MIDVSCWFRQGNVCINFIRLHYSFHYLNFSLFFLREKTDFSKHYIWSIFGQSILHTLFYLLVQSSMKKSQKEVYVSFLVCQLHLYRTDDTEKYLVICMLYYYNGK